MSPKYPETLNQLIAHLKKLPGVGRRTAERFAFELINWKPEELQEFGQVVTSVATDVTRCPCCSCLTQEGICPFCDNTERNASSLCIVSSPREVYAIEEIRAFRGLYHIIEHLLSPLDGRHTSTLQVSRIEKRIIENQIKEIILAFDSTLEGDATALYLKQELSKYPVSITRLGFGLPVGSSLEFVDGSTLAKAFSGRQIV